MRSGDPDPRSTRPAGAATDLTRRGVLRGAAALGAGALGCARPRRRPNLLWIVVDQHRFDVAGHLGDPRAVTPNLDRLAAGSARFGTTYCQVPLCAPARQSLLTGQYAHTHTTFRNDDVRLEGLWTVPQALARAGWRTALFGKTHCDTAGFQRVRDLDLMLEDFRAEHPGRGRVGEGRFTFDKQDEDFDYVAMMNPGFERAGPGEHFFMEEAVAREASAFLREQDERPFFAWASFVNPHPPLFPPDEFHALFEGRELPLRGSLEHGGGELLPAHAERRVKQGLDQLDDGDLLGITRAYYASLAWTDHCVGRLLDALEDAGAADETVVIYTSDHGEMLGEHGLLKKLTFYEGAVRVPCAIRWPRVVTPRSIERVVQHVDLAPTVLELLEADAYDGEDPLPGRSLVPLLATGEDPERSDLAIAELAGGGELHWMVRDGRYKLARYGSNGQLLHDLGEDPGETRNLAGEPGSAELIEALAARFDEATAGTTWRVPR